MPLFAILHVDHEGLHSSSCAVIAASSELSIAQNIVDNPERWQTVLRYAYPDDGDSRSIWQRLQTTVLTPQALLILINKTTLDIDFGEVLRIEPIEIQCLDDLAINTRWSVSKFSTINSTEVNAVTPERNLLSTVYPQLTEDARSVLATQGFQQYIQVLQQQNIWQHSNLCTLNLIQPELSTWLLSSLSIPIRLSNIEIRENSTNRDKLKKNYCYFHSNIQFGMWSTHLKIAIDKKYEYYCELGADQLGERWLDVGNSLKKSIELLGFWIAPEILSEQQPRLLMELTSLLSYIIELFSSKTRIYQRLEKL